MPIPLEDVRAAWELCGLKEAGLPLREWFRYAVALDDTVIEFYNSRRPRK